MLEPGRKLGQYEILARLKSGGMATLYLGRRVGAAGFARPVAIKVVHPHLSSDPAFVSMFIAEAKLSARIQHPNVVHVEELGVDAGTYFLAMQYVDGVSLSQLLRELAKRERKLSLEAAVFVAMQIADGLQAAHEASDEEGRALGVVHRDVSPQNVLLSEAGHVKLIDFGIAKTRDSQKQTMTGALKGKLRYMSPEQAYGDPVDHRADIYALGVVLWEMLTMRRLFQADTELALLDRVREPDIVPPSTLAPEVPTALDDAVMWALAYDAKDRPESTRALRRRLAEALPAATQVEPVDIADLMHAVLGAKLEAARRALPASSGLATSTGSKRPRKNADNGGAVEALTVSAPGASALESVESMEPTSSPPPQDASLGSMPIATAPGRAEGFKNDRWLALAFGAVAIGIAAYVVSMPSPQGAQEAPPPVAAPPAVEPAPAIVAPNVVTTVTHDASVEDPADAEVETAAPIDDTERRARRNRRARLRRARGMNDQVDGVPIFDDEF